MGIVGGGLPELQLLVKEGSISWALLESVLCCSFSLWMALSSQSFLFCVCSFTAAKVSPVRAPGRMEAQ